MESFAITVNGFSLLTTVAKLFILVVYGSLAYAFACEQILDQSHQSNVFIAEFEVSNHRLTKDITEAIEVDLPTPCQYMGFLLLTSNRFHTVLVFPLLTLIK